MNEVKELKINNLSDDVNHIIFPDGKELYLIGTAHVSAESVKTVEETITEVKPDTIAVELDEQRLEVIKNRKKYEETDIIQVIKTKKTLFFISQLMMSAYQKKIAKRLGVKPGAEFKKAVDLAEETESELILADRNIGVTLKRLMRKLTFMDKAKFLASMLFAKDEDKNISEDSLKELKQKDNLTALIGEMADEMPLFKKVLLDERNEYLATKIKANLGEKTVAAVGAAHVPGILEYLEADLSESNLEKLDEIPPKTKVSKFIPWIFPLIIVAVFIYGFFNGNTEQMKEAAVYWVLINGFLTSIGCLIALGHPLTVVAGFIAAPITSLNPTIGAGMVVGLLQIFLVKPKVKDIEDASDDIAKAKGWWKNRLTRALLVTLFASLGSSIGSFVAFPFILKLLG